MADRIGMSRWEKWSELPHHNVVKLHRGNRYGGSHYLQALDEHLSEIPQKSLDLPFIKPKEEFAGNSCGGLLFFVVHGVNCDDPIKFFLFNPKTNKRRSFFHDDVFTGALGYDHKSGNYKMVSICYDGNVRTYAEVYSLSKQVWTLIDSVPRSLPSGGNVYVAAAGKSYWCDAEGVVAFDFSEDKFTYIDFPPLPYFYCKVKRELVNIRDGLLGVVCYWKRGTHVSFDDEYPGYYYQLWALREEEEEWYRMFDVVCLCGGAGRPVGLINGRFLILQGMSDSDYDVMLAYDWVTQNCINTGLYIYDSCYYPLLSYVETEDELPPPPPQGQDDEEEEKEKEEEQQQQQPAGPIILPRRFKVHGVTEDTRGDDGKEYLYEEIEDKQYTDWTKGFRVVEKYHPSEKMYVYEFDYKPESIYYELLERGIDDPDDKWTPYIYTDQLRKMKIDDHDATATQREEPIENDNNKRQNIGDPTPLSSSWRSKRKRSKRKRSKHKRSKHKRKSASVYAYGCPSGITEDDLRKFFKKAGTIGVNMIKPFSDDVWHIIYADRWSVSKAISLSGDPIFGQPILVSEYPVNCTRRLPPTPTATKTIRLRYLPPTVLEWHLKQLFCQFGRVTRVSVGGEGECAIVEFYEVESAKKAQQFDGKLQIGGNNIEVTFVEE